MRGSRAVMRLWVALAVVVLACGEKASGPTGPILPSNGEIRLGLSTPNGDDRAIMLMVTGEIGGLEAAEGFTAFVRTEGETTTAVLVRDGGEAIPTGGVEVAVIRVEGPSADFSVKLTQVATRTHAVRGSLDAYSLSMRTD
jgi:hypothetical protein